MEEAKRKKILELYQGRYAKRQIEMIVHSDKRTITKVINDALAKGEVQETKAIRCDKGKLSESKRAISARRAQLAQQVRYAHVCDLFSKGYTTTEICAEIKASQTTIAKIINNAISNGDVFSKDSIEYKRAKAEHRRERGIDLNRKRKRDLSHIKSTLAENETVKCTRKISKTCIYGTEIESDSVARCRYSLITGKCRSVGEGACSWKVCTKYSKVSAENPRLLIEGEEFNSSFV